MHPRPVWLGFSNRLEPIDDLKGKWRPGNHPTLIMNKARPDTVPVLSVLLKRDGIPSTVRLQPVIMSLVLRGWHLCHDHDRPAPGLAAGAGVIMGFWPVQHCNFHDRGGLSGVGSD